MLINFSNHPSSDWCSSQVLEAEKRYGNIVDVEFPDISPSTDKVGVLYLAQVHVAFIKSNRPSAVHIMGELNFTFACVTLLKSIGIICVASTTERISEVVDGKKTSIFRFVQFREY
jgi:hypothetical protein